MSPKTTYDEETKAAAMAALLVGGRVRQIACAHGVPEGTVKSWRHRLKNGRVATLKKGEFGGMVLTHLDATLRSLIAQSGHLSDPERLREMGAHEAGVFFGVLFDRTMRALELAPALLRDLKEEDEHDKTRQNATAKRSATGFARRSPGAHRAPTQRRRCADSRRHRRRSRPSC